MNLLESKKGLIKGSIGVLIVLIIFVFVNMFNYTLMSNFKGAINQTIANPNHINSTADKFLFVFELADYLIILLLIGLILSSAILNRRIATSPGYFIGAIISLPILGLFSYFFNFVFISLVTNDLFNSILHLYPRSMLICTNLHWVALINFSIGAISLFGKKEKTQDIIT